MGRFVDLTGRKFGRLVVLERAGVYAKNGEVTWACQCECGTVKDITGTPLRRGVTVSCGCHREEVLATARFTANLKHGGARNGVRTAEYRSWQNMLRRCYNPKNSNYRYYGGRGIQVCARWRGDFGAFLADMGPKPSSKHTLDRIDVDGHYEPGNCRWATLIEQANNKRKRAVVTDG